MNSNIHFIYAGYEPLLRILFVGTIGYFFLLLTLRISAPRVLAKANVFDFIIAVGVGSAFGRVLTAKEVALAEACTAFALLAVLQFLVSKLRVHFPAARKLTDAKPILVYFNGSFVPGAQKEARLTVSDVEEAVRAHGIGSFADVEAIVLEASGDLAVIRKSPEGREPALVTGLRSYL